jgi:CRISPR-associated exonuclease Cas4
MTMGDRDYRSLIKNAIDSIGRELNIEIDSKDLQTIHLHEVVRCLRRSYYDRTDPEDVQRRGFNELSSGLLRKLNYGAKPTEFDIEEIKLKGQADMMVDDVIILFRAAAEPPENPLAGDLLYLNACMWMYNKIDGIIIYITGDSRESSFSLSKDKKMFEEIVRRVRVLNDLLKEQKLPILEPSDDCLRCQYYERCYIKQKIGKSISIAELVGLKKD